MVDKDTDFKSSLSSIDKSLADIANSVRPKTKKDKKWIELVQGGGMALVGIYALYVLWKWIETL